MSASIWSGPSELDKIQPISPVLSPPPQTARRKLAGTEDIVLVVEASVCASYRLVMEVRHASFGCGNYEKNSSNRVQRNVGIEIADGRRMQAPGRLKPALKGDTLPRNSFRLFRKMNNSSTEKRRVFFCVSPYDRWIVFYSSRNALELFEQRPS